MQAPSVLARVPEAFREKEESRFWPPVSSWRQGCLPITPLLPFVLICPLLRSALGESAAYMQFSALCLQQQYHTKEGETVPLFMLTPFPLENKCLHVLVLLIIDSICMCVFFCSHLVNYESSTHQLHGRQTCRNFSVFQPEQKPLEVQNPIYSHYRFITKGQLRLPTLRVYVCWGGFVRLKLIPLTQVVHF